VPDVNYLERWIQPQHLAEDRIQSYRDSFRSHPAQMNVIPDFLVEPAAEKLASFLSREGTFQDEHGLYSNEQGVDEETWLAADEGDRFFRFGKLTGTPPEHQFSPNALTYLQFRKVFQDDRFRGFFEESTGLALTSSDDFGSHRMRAGDFLREHDDDNKDRRLALVLYLTPDWKPSFGGALHMRDRNNDVHVVDATYNSLVMFDTLAETVHYVQPIATSAGDLARYTIGGWYHKTTE